MTSEPNPYAPPRKEPRPRKRRGARRAPGEWVKWAYAAAALCFVLPALIATLGAAMLHPYLLFLYPAPSLLGLVWLYLAWGGLPYEYREDISPGSSVLRFFVPFYNLYWCFAVNPALCRRIDELLARAGKRRGAPTGLAILAVLLHFAWQLVFTLDAGATMMLLVLAFYAAEAVVWFLYMQRCDVLRRAVYGMRVD